MFTEVPANKRSLSHRRPIYGVGGNDAPYMVELAINGKKTVCKFYSTWKSMFVRCYSNKYKSAFNTYAGCSVSEEWHSFMAFKRWMMQQDWKGKHLDKDILKYKNKIYSKNYCIFVPPELNMLLTDSSKARGKYPVGVGFHKSENKIYASCGINGKQKHLGYFTNVADAFSAYKEAKSQYIISLADKYSSDERLSDSLTWHANRVLNMTVEQSLNNSR